MTEPVDSLEIAEDKRLSVMPGPDGLTALPMMRTGDGAWRRAHPGDGLASALLELLAAVPDSTTRGRFTLRSWSPHSAGGERSVGVDQTNESVIVGDAAVVKWATHLQEGPHPTPRRISTLHDAGFTGMPRPWGIVTWRPEQGAETMVASVDEYLPGAVDGWTWAVDLITEAARDRRPDNVVTAASDVGRLVAEMHSALSATATTATRQDADRWRAEAFRTLETACALDDSNSIRCARIRRGEIVATLDGLGALAGTVIIEGHGDLHVGQVLHDDNRFVVTDFDGNPVLPAPQRVLPIPAALDVAGMVQSLAHAAIVARRHTELEPAALAAVDRSGRGAFLDAYGRRLTELGQSALYDRRSLHAFRVQQVLREMVYAAAHLPRWMYVPDSALPALLDEGTDT